MKTAFLVASLLMASSCGLAQVDTARAGGIETRSRSAVFGSDCAKAVQAAGYIFSSPARWQGGSWLAAGGVLAATAGASLLDNDLRSAMLRSRTHTNDQIEKVVVHYGEASVVLLTSTGAYAAGLFLEDRWLRETALLTGCAVVFSGTLSTTVKAVAGRARPFVGRGNGTFRPFTFKDAYFSFPSGHTVVAFSLSTVLAERIGNPWATAGLYGAATACAVSRVYRQEHWLSDIVLGAALSTAVSHSLVQWYEGGREPSLTSRLHILPGIQGVALVWAL